MIGSIDHYISRLTQAAMLAMERIEPEMKKHFEAEGITQTQFYVLLYLSKHGGCKVSDLAKWMEVKPSAMTTIIDRLVQNDFVVREHDAADRRIVRIDLTPNGKQRLDGIKNKRRAIFKRDLSHLTEDELRTFTEIFEKIAGVSEREMKGD